MKNFEMQSLLDAICEKNDESVKTFISFQV